MRLTIQQIEIIKQKTVKIFGENAKVYLFGSRVDDAKKSGDIDLLIETSEETTLMDKLQLMALIQLVISNRKIDLLVKTIGSFIFRYIKIQDLIGEKLFKEFLISVSD
jgi:predicted nucleotidyltransferase